MAPSKLPATGDFRSEAKEYQRDRNHNAKWARGFAPAVGKKCPHLSSGLEACLDCAARPALLDRGARHFKGYPSSKLNMARKATRNSVLTTDDITGPSDSSAGEEDLKEASAAPVPDAEVMYSFDASTGPGRGNDILSSAISRAVERYENKVTEKLAKEYEFVDSGKEHGDGYTADADEDDFEMINHANLQ